MQVRYCVIHFANSTLKVCYAAIARLVPIRTICGSAIDHTVDVAVDNGLYYRAHIGAVTYYLLRFPAPLTGFRGFCRKAGLLSNFFSRTSYRCARIWISTVAATLALRRSASSAATSLDFSPAHRLLRFKQYTSPPRSCLYSRIIFMTFCAGALRFVVIGYARREFFVANCRDTPTSPKMILNIDQKVRSRMIFSKITIYAIYLIKLRAGVFWGCNFNFERDSK